MKPGTSKSPIRSVASKPATLTKARLSLLTQWVLSLHVWEKVAQKDLPEHLRTGVLFARIIEAYDPNVQFALYKRPVAKKACLNNIEQVLAVIWKKSVSASSIPSSEEIYQSRAEKAWSLLNCIFEIYPLQDAKNAMKEALPSIQRTLSLYGCQLRPQSVSSPFLTLFEDCASCVPLICYVHCYAPLGTINMKEVYWSPDTPEELHSNVEFLFDLLATRGLPCFFSVPEYADKADTDFLLLQIYVLWAALKNSPACVTDGRSVVFKDEARQCTRPEAPSNRSSSSLFSIESPSLTYSASTRILSDQNHSRDSSTSSNLPPPGSFSQPIGPSFIVQKLTKERLDSMNSSVHQGEGSSFGTVIKDKLEESKDGLVQFESVSPPSSIYSGKVGNKLAKMEKMNMLQERKLLFLADLRRKAELKKDFDGLKPVVRSISPNTENGRPRSKSPTSYHLQNPKYYQSQTSLTLTESLTCFLMTPRMLRLAVNGEPEFFPFIFNLVPNEQKYSAANEYYFFEWRDLASLEVVGSLDMTQMISVAKEDDNMFVLKYPTFPDSSENETAYLVDCSDRSECNKYIEGLMYLLHRGKKKSLMSPP